MAAAALFKFFFFYLHAPKWFQVPRTFFHTKKLCDKRADPLLLTQKLWRTLGHHSVLATSP
jgi:hypothetical protein